LVSIPLTIRFPNFSAGLNKMLASLMIGAVAAHGIDNIVSLRELNEAIADPSHISKVGFLSDGNFQSVQNELHETVDPVIFDSSTNLTAAVEAGDVLAGLVSGTPSDPNGKLNVFGSEQISVRAMLVKQGNGAIVDALDAALVRIIQRGDVEKIAEANAPYEALVVHSCKPTSSHFVWPNMTSMSTFGLSKGGTLKICALGPFDWGGTDGNYKVDPPVGFWPDYYTHLETEFKQTYDMTFERVYYTTSAALMDGLNSGACHASEPYMMLGSAHTGSTSRKTAFDETCITSATNDKYFTKRGVPESEEELAEVWIGLGVACSFALLISLFAFHMFRKERSGAPVFSPIPIASSVEMQKAPARASSKVDAAHNC